MEISSTQLQAKLMREYYKYFSKYTKGKNPDKKIAWVTAFTPVEILDALDISYFYPESYAAVIAASGKEQKMLEESERKFLNNDCCSYSCCFEGCLSLEEAPRGMPPKPDVLIATNNQCNTLPNWWNILAEKYDVPLIVLDYPGEAAEFSHAYDYVTQQHKIFINDMENLSGNKLDENILLEKIENSKASVKAWQKIIDLLPKYEIPPTVLFDSISFLITSRCKAETSMLYEMMSKELKEMPIYDGLKTPLYWLGYPLWYHNKRYLEEYLENFKVVGSNYITWWCLDYKGTNIFENLFFAYNNTFLNLKKQTKKELLTNSITSSGAKCAITLHNKSCKCDFVSAHDIDIIQAEIEIDMIDREFANYERIKNQINQLLESI